MDDESRNASKPTPRDALEGMAWWNSLTRAERRHWMDRAGSARPADAWNAYMAVQTQVTRASSRRSSGRGTTE